MSVRRHPARGGRAWQRRQDTQRNVEHLPQQWLNARRPYRLVVERRDTWATHTLEAGKSIRWVAAQLSHADPALTLRVYAHAMRGEEADLTFADFGASA